jgi:hypothetical protein
LSTLPRWFCSGVWSLGSDGAECGGSIQTRSQRFHPSFSVIETGQGEAGQRAKSYLESGLSISFWINDPPGSGAQKPDEPGRIFKGPIFWQGSTASKEATFHLSYLK